MRFFVKVRIDTDKMEELGRKLASGELDRSSYSAVYCHQFDPEVGVSVWEADSVEDFYARFAPHRAYYRDLLEVTPLILPSEAMQILSGRRVMAKG